jgi:hypothetical protein
MKKAGQIVRIHIGRVRRKGNRNVGEGSITMEIPDTDPELFENAVRTIMEFDRKRRGTGSKEGA